MVNMTPRIFRVNDRHRFFGCDPAGFIRIVFDYKTGERLTDHQAYIQRQARVGLG